jgi:hypothetical protein
VLEGGLAGGLPVGWNWSRCGRLTDPAPDRHREVRSEIRLGWILVSTARRNMLAVCAFTIAIACAVRAASSLDRSSVLQVFRADGFQIHPGNWWRLDGLVRVGGIAARRRHRALRVL